MDLQICKIVKNYGKKSVLNGVNIDAEKGTCVGILGVNGSGKSTLFNILAGITHCDAGSFFYNGNDLLSRTGTKSSIIGYVPQTPPLIEELSCLDNLKIWYGAKGLKRELSENSKDSVIKLLGVDSFLKTSVRKMSGGMKKRLSIACAVANNPKILIMDEPTAALDVICKKDVFDYIRHFTALGGTVLVSTHDLSELLICEKVYVLKNGVAISYDFDGDSEKLIGYLKND